MRNCSRHSKIRGQKSNYVAFNMTMLWGLVFFGLLAGAFGQIRLTGSCPQLETMKDFDATRFVGLWYHHEYYPKWFKYDSKCAIVDFSMRQNDTSFVGIWTYTVTSTGIQTATPAVYRAPDPIDPAKFKTILTWTTNERDWWILDTNYETYAIVYQCFYGAGPYTQYVAILTREVNPSQDVMAEIDEAIKTKTNFKRAAFVKVPHDNCEVKPVSTFTAQ